MKGGYRDEKNSEEFSCDELTVGEGNTVNSGTTVGQLSDVVGITRTALDEQEGVAVAINEGDN